MWPRIVDDGSMRKKGTQEGSIREKDGNWYGSYYRWVADPDGNLKYKRRETALEAKNETAAKKEVRKLAEEANVQSAMPEGACTLRQFIDARFQKDHIDNLREGGKVHYKTQLNHILPTLGDIALKDIRPTIVQALIIAKSKKGLSAQSVRHIRNALSAILGYARDLELIDGRLATEAVKIPKGEAAQRRALTFEQAQLLLDALPLKYRPVIRFLLETGARASEAAGIRWADINLTDTASIVDGEVRRPYTVHFRHAFKFGEYTELKTGRSRRDVPMTSGLWIELQALYERRRPDSDIVFSAVRSHRQQARPIDMHNFLVKVIKPLAVKLGMPWLNIHCLRHTTSTWLDAAGAPIGQKNLLMGHADNRTAMRYTHAETTSQRIAIEKATEKLSVQ